jgi:type IV pilus assembly protein PilM
MLAFFKQLLTPQKSAIGVSFGTHAIRLAHCSLESSSKQHEHILHAAAICAVPEDVRTQEAVRSRFYVDSLKAALVRGRFSTRRAVLGVPNWMVHVRQLRVPKVDPTQLPSAIEAELSGKLASDISNYSIRHTVAGDLNSDQGNKQEVVVYAIEKNTLQELLDGAEAAKLDVVGVGIETKAIVDCFGHVYRRKIDATAVTMFIDIGGGGTRCIIARGAQTLFTRSIPIGGEHFDHALAQSQSIADSAAEQMRQAVSRSRVQHVEGDARAGTIVLPTSSIETNVKQTTVVEASVRQVASKLADELDLCRRYHEVTFAGLPVDRLLFVGGVAKDFWMLRLIAERLQLPAQLADPLVRMNRRATIDPDCGLDRREPQPAWAAAVGLSLGPPND